MFSGAEKLKALELHEEICRLIEAGKDHEVEQAMTGHNDLGRVYGDWIDPNERVDAQAIRQSR